MVLGVSWLVLAHAATGLAILGLFAPVWTFRERPGAQLWAGVVALMAATTFAFGAALLVFDPALRVVMEAVSLAGLVWTALLFLCFALAYTGRAHLLRSWWLRGLVVVQGLGTALLLSNPSHHLLWTDFRLDPVFGAAAVAYAAEPGLYVLAGVTYLTVGIGIVMLVETVASYGPAYRRQAIAIATTPLFPVGASLVWLLEIGPYPQLNLIALSFLPHLVLDVYALFGRDMFDLPPGLRRAGERAALDDLGSPVFIVAADGRIIETNSAVERLFGLDTAAALARPLSDLLGPDVEMTAGEQRVELRADGERKTFKLVFSPFETRSGLHGGYTVIAQDVTAEIQRKQRLEVLNRILRHNLRNDLNVVQLHAQELELSLSDPESRRHAAAIEDVSSDLVSLGEKARWAAQALEAVSSHPVTIRDLLEDVVADVGETYPDASVELDVPADATLHTDPEVLTLVFTSVLENAIEHNDGDPSVTITVTDDGADSLRVRISDDGPGIPAHERRVIEDGGETALDHGSGVGLWLIHWGVTLLGGDVSFEVDGDGTTVAIRLPTSGDPDGT
ncbi:histidine kinase N-terminal 7TM domain-containing protein [Halorientalis halophila]|uniref:histidine kinase N-terminal 7TM domain-containing protein n=1 Tax=Halorientalis halophila TaxID=3108499 RepID=UPI00300B7D70